MKNTPSYTCIAKEEQNCILKFELENKRWDFYFAHLRWCHNGWASNILSGECRRSRYPPRLRYWMPIHYVTIEDGQNKKSHLLFSLVRTVWILYFIGVIYCQKYHSFHWLHLNNHTPKENKCFNPRNQKHCAAFFTRINSVCVQMRHSIRGVCTHLICHYYA